MAKSEKATKKTYILELANGNTRKITIPATWKMTFGSLVPFKTRGGGYEDGRSGVALRLYDGNKDNLRAVMTDVRAIRDASIEIIEKRSTVQRKTAQKETPKGMKDVIIEARMTEWVNPDAEDDDAMPTEFLKLSAPSSDD